MWEGNAFFLVPVAHYTDKLLPFHEEREAYWASRDIIVNADELPADLVVHANRHSGINQFVEQEQKAAHVKKMGVKLIRKEHGWMNIREMTVGDTVYPFGTRFEETYNIHLYGELDGGGDFLRRVNSSLVKCGEVWVLVQDCPV